MGLVGKSAAEEWAAPIITKAHSVRAMDVFLMTDLLVGIRPRLQGLRENPSPSGEDFSFAMKAQRCTGTKAQSRETHPLCPFVPLCLCACLHSSDVSIPAKR